MTALCPHCTAALSTYTTHVDSEPTNIEVLVCAHCDKVLGVVGPARGGGPRLDVEEVAELLSVAVNTDDDDEARTVFSIVIDKIDSTVETGGGGIDDAQFSRLLERYTQNLYDRMREQKRQDAERRQRPQ
jgi:hypothetical protein